MHRVFYKQTMKVATSELLHIYLSNISEENIYIFTSLPKAGDLLLCAISTRPETTRWTTQTQMNKTSQPGMMKPGRTSKLNNTKKRRNTPAESRHAIEQNHLSRVSRFI